MTFLTTNLKNNSPVLLLLYRKFTELRAESDSSSLSSFQLLQFSHLRWFKWLRFIILSNILTPSFLWIRRKSIIKAIGIYRMFEIEQIPKWYLTTDHKIRMYVWSSLFHGGCQVLNDRVEVLSVRFPFFQAFLSVTLELLVLVLQVSLRLFSLCELSSEFLLSLLLLLLHLPLQLISILLVDILSEFLLIGLFLLESGQLIFPGFFELMIVFKFLLFLTSSSFHLVFQWLFILLLEDTLLFCLLPLDFSLLLLKFLDLVIETLNIVVLDLAHLEGLLLVEFFSLFDLFINQILLSLLGDLLDHFYINENIPCFLRYYSILASSSFSFWSSKALNSLFFSLISLISFLFCMFLSLLSRYFSSSWRIASSALSFKSAPSSISSLYWLMYFFFTYLCCFLRFFSKSFSFFFSASLRFCSSS